MAIPLPHRLGLLLLVVGSGVAAAQAPWRSRLYPRDWAPSTTDADGRFLPDFSYAGYAAGERPLPRVEGPRFDVVRYGADATGATDATVAIQRAVDAAAKAGGGVVVFPAGAFRVDGAVKVRASRIVLRGAGPAKTRLLLRLPVDSKAPLHLIGKARRKGDRPLEADARPRAMHVVADPTGLKPGDEVAIGCTITDAFRAAHGMQDYWRFSAGKWRAFLRRTITRIDGREIHLDAPVRYPLLRRDGASLTKLMGALTEVGVESLAVCTAAGREVWSKHTRCAAIQLSHCKDAWVRDVHSVASEVAAHEGKHLQSCGIRVVGCRRVTIADCRMSKPQHRGGGGNGYLFEISRSNEVLVRDCQAADGRHNFIQNWDFGTSGCVWLRVRSERSVAVNMGFPMPAASEYHHALATACLVDRSHVADGWYAENRHRWSSGAGITATQCVFWNVVGGGRIRSMQYGLGYVIGTGAKVRVETDVGSVRARGTAPEDWTEGLGRAATLDPPSLYEDQLKRRLERQRAGRR